MKCPKCGYVSHDYLDACRKCSIDLVAFKHEISLAVLEPGLLDLAALVNGNSVGSANGHSGEYDKSSSFLGTSMLVETETAESGEEEEVDIRLDDDVLNTVPGSNQAPGSLTREFFVPDELLTDEVKETRPDDHDATTDTQATSESDNGIQMVQDPITEEILNLDFDDDTISNETFFTESVTDDSTDIIDMNALQELRDTSGESEEVDIEAIEAASEPDDSAAIQMDSAVLDAEDTLLEENAAMPSPDQADSPSDLIDEFDQLDSMPLQEVATEEVSDAADDQLEADIAELSNASGSLELPDDFQLGDFQVDDAQPEDSLLEQPDTSGGIDLPENFQLSASTPEEPAAPGQLEAPPAAAVEPEPAPSQNEPAPEREEKITLSLPIDPNTETLFFDQLSDDTSDPAAAPGQEPADHDTAAPHDSTDTPVAAEAEPLETPIPLDELSSELLTDDLLGSESTLELNLELELPNSEPLVADDADEVPVDLEQPDSDKGTTEP